VFCILVSNLAPSETRFGRGRWIGVGQGECVDHVSIVLCWKSVKKVPNLNIAGALVCQSALLDWRFMLRWTTDAVSCFVNLTRRTL
jgi:hypothetical protein